MKGRAGAWLLFPLPAALLAGLLFLHAPGAGASGSGGGTDPDRRALGGGKMTVIAITGDQVRRRASRSLVVEDIEPEKCEPSEEDWAFIRDAATNLSEEEKTRFVTEVREIYAGESTLSQGEQDDLERRLGWYLIEATEGAGTTP